MVAKPTCVAILHLLPTSRADAPGQGVEVRATSAGVCREQYRRPGARTMGRARLFHFLDSGPSIPGLRFERGSACSQPLGGGDDEREMEGSTDGGGPGDGGRARGGMRR